jgi:hypothetical protein
MNVSDRRRLVHAAMMAGLVGAGVDPSRIWSRHPSAVRARWGAWLALSTMLTPHAIARGCGFDHATIYNALPKARRLRDDKDHRLVLSFEAARAAVDGLLECRHAQATSGGERPGPAGR